MQRIRVLLVAVPPLLGDVLRETAEPGVRMIGEHADTHGVVGAVDEGDANVVVLGTSDHGLPHLASVLFDRFPRLLVIAITVDGRRATIHELRPHSQLLGEMSPRELMAAIRAAVGAQAGVW